MSTKKIQINIPKWTWKTIIVLDKPGAEITKNTTGYTFLTPNSAEGTDPNSTQLYNFEPITWSQLHPFNKFFNQDRVISSVEEWRNSLTWRISLNQLETLLKDNVSLANGQQFDFLLNVPKNIKYFLKGEGEYDPNKPLSAFLQADVNPATSSEILLENVIPTNLALLFSTKIEGKTGDKNSVFSNNIPELTRIFPKSAQLSTLNVDSSESGRSQIAYLSLNLSQIAIKKPSVTQVTRLDVGIPQVTVTEFSPNQFATSPVDTAQVDMAKLSTFQAYILQFNSTQVGVLQNDSLKIPLPSSISPQELPSIHTLTLESIITINNTAQTLWNTVFAPQTPFNINLFLHLLPRQRTTY